MGRISSILVLVFCSCAFAQISTDDAQKRLEEREKARVADREKLVTIKKGELDDLHAQVAQLTAQLAQLREQLGQLAAANAQAKAREMTADVAIRRHQILKGMTKEQVLEALKCPEWSGTRTGTVVDNSVEPGPDPDALIIRWHMYVRNAITSATTTYRKGFAEIRGGVVTRTEETVDDDMAWYFPMKK